MPAGGFDEQCALERRGNPPPPSPRAQVLRSGAVPAHSFHGPCHASANVAMRHVFRWAVPDLADGMHLRRCGHWCFGWRRGIGEGRPDSRSQLL